MIIVACLSTVGCWLLFIGGGFSFGGCWLMVVGLSLVGGCWLIDVGSWLMGGCWLVGCSVLVVCCWLVVDCI